MLDGELGEELGEELGAGLDDPPNNFCLILCAIEYDGAPAAGLSGVVGAGDVFGCDFFCAALLFAT